VVVAAGLDCGLGFPIAIGKPRLIAKPAATTLNQDNNNLVIFSIQNSF